MDVPHGGVETARKCDFLVKTESESEMNLKC